jgi:hypothetical protein
MSALALGRRAAWLDPLPGEGYLPGMDRLRRFAERAGRWWWALLLVAGIGLWLVGMSGWPNDAVSIVIFVSGLAVIVTDGVLVGRSSSNS